MMFLVHIAFSLIVAVFVAGCVLIVWSQKETVGKTLLKVAGYSAVILSLSNALCLGYYAVRYWEDGYFKAPFVSQNTDMDMMSMMKMMHGKGMGRPMMQGMMKGDAMKGDTNNDAPAESANTDDHEAHH